MNPTPGDLRTLDSLAAWLTSPKAGELSAADRARYAATLVRVVYAARHAPPPGRRIRFDARGPYWG
jgi:hypothetical protein